MSNLFLELESSIEALDTADERKRTTIPPGRHRVMRIHNPHGRAADWLVLVGTSTGAAESYFRSTIGAKIEE